MATNDRGAILKGIELGLAAEAFIHSDLGKFLLERAQDEAIEAVNELKSIDPTLVKEITALQNVIYRSEQFELWLMEAINVGKNSEEQLELADKQD